jgi:hypothetical protein
MMRNTYLKYFKQDKINRGSTLVSSINRYSATANEENIKGVAQSGHSSPHPNFYLTIQFYP